MTLNDVILEIDSCLAEIGRVLRGGRVCPGCGRAFHRSTGHPFRGRLYHDRPCAAASGHRGAALGVRASGAAQ
jgi:hypothetical protein